MPQVVRVSLIFTGGQIVFFNNLGHNLVLHSRPYLTGIKLSGENTLAYYASLSATKNIFIILPPRSDVIKHFTTVVYKFLQ